MIVCIFMFCVSALVKKYTKAFLFAM